MDNRIANGEALDLNKRDIIRISRDISDKEKAIIRTRQIKVHSCLQKLGANFPMSNVPNIAVLGSGGSLRAMIALQGVLGELQKQGLLDAVMYLCECQALHGYQEVRLFSQKRLELYMLNECKRMTYICSTNNHAGTDQVILYKYLQRLIP
uniref:Cytosolic phospholipase A2 zeta-like n=1 Tax=Pogona vitticeps TaxID=103695 RepID=A0ABM5GPZ2_9SAUR